MGSFHYDRERLMDNLGRDARRVVDTYDKSAESQAIAEGAQVAVAASAAVGVGAVGLGALVTILATTMAADITGVLMATMIAVLGLFIIPARRRAAKADLHEKVTTLRQQLMGSLRAQFDREIERSLLHINEAIAPYTRFVRAEQSKLLEMQSGLEKIQGDLELVKQKIEEL
jgi:hypothetical protein